jgi:imidazolonepropionase-like amidohydrolase
MAIAPVLKTGVRKDLGVRIPRPPFIGMRRAPGNRSRVLAQVALCALAPWARPLAAQRPDTARYVVLFSDRPAGTYTEWRNGNDLRAAFDYNDRGRGPHLEVVVRLGATPIPDRLTIVGHGYLKDTVDDRLSHDGTTAAWKNNMERGTRSNAATAFYVDATEAPTGSRLLVRAAMKSGGRIPLLPSGEATVQKGASATIQTADGPVRLTQYDVGGLGFTPVPIWLDDALERFAMVSGWISIVPAGWERAVPELVRIQDVAGVARFSKLAHDLAHRSPAGLAITNARLFVAESATVRPHTTVVVQGNRIAAVGADGSVPIPDGVRRIDAGAKTLLPGLWDMHAHISPGEDGLLHIAAGVTTIRDMGNDSTVTLALRRQFATDSLIGPRLILAGLIDGSGPFQVPIGVLADDSATARRAVTWFAEHGFEQIKIYSSMKPELVPVIIAAAHARGLRVSGHVPAYMTAEQVVKLGFDEVQHANMLMLNFMDSVRDTRSMARFTEVGAHGYQLDFGSPRVRDFVALLKARGTDIDPTLVAFDDMFNARPGALGPANRAIADRMPAQVRRGFLSGGLPVTPALDTLYRDSYRAMMRMVKTMYDAGVPIVAGTDAGPVGFALHRELELYVEAGIPAPAVLRIATLGAARVMHHDDDRGSVAVGKLADLVLVDGDPTTRISDIRRTSLVVKNGIVYMPDEIYRALGITPIGPAKAAGQ